MKKLLIILCLAVAAQAAPQPNPPKVQFTFIDYAPPRITTRISLIQYLRWLYLYS